VIQKQVENLVKKFSLNHFLQRVKEISRF